jgi:hypothetical protein
VQVFYAEAEGFGEAEAAAIKKGGDEPVCTWGHGLEEPAYLVAREDGGKALGAIDPLERSDLAERIAEHGLIEKGQGIEGLILRGSGHVPMDGQVIEEGT